MIKYRISKYNPKYRNYEGIFLKEDWTSYSDIGKIYNGKIFTKEDYINIEKLYCECIFSIITDLGIKKLVIQKLELYFSLEEIIKLLKSSDLELTYIEKQIINNIMNGMSISLYDLNSYLRLLLRECFWCYLVHSKFKITVGYDFYIYLYCNSINLKIIEDYKKKGIFIENLSE